jgi:hypothetical protein
MDVYRTEIIQAGSVGRAHTQKKKPYTDRSHLLPYTLLKKTSSAVSLLTETNRSPIESACLLTAPILQVRAADDNFSIDVAPLGTCEVSEIVHVSRFHGDMHGHLVPCGQSGSYRMTLVGSRLVWHSKTTRLVRWCECRCTVWSVALLNAVILRIPHNNCPAGHAKRQVVYTKTQRFLASPTRLRRNGREGKRTHNLLNYPRRWS